MTSEATSREASSKIATLVAALDRAYGLASSLSDAAEERETLQALRLRAKKLARAASRKQALGLFGPSQAGKSFLVGGLLGHDVGSLDVLGRSGRFDFLKELNPNKGVESTGVVSRFTATIPSLSRGDFRASILPLETVLEALGTGFLVECTPPAPDPERVDRALRAARLAAGTADATVVRFREAWESAWFTLGKKYGDKHPYLAELRRHPELQSGRFADGISSRDGWLEAFALLWGGGGPTGAAPDLDRLARMIVLGLDGLSHPEAVEVDAAHVRASEEASSLLDASCLNALGTGLPAISVYNPAIGAPSAVDPGLLAALVAEIAFPLQAPTGSLLAEADILDFPGGRALKGLSGFGPKDLASGRLEAALEVYKRGKLTVLFEQFTVEREITVLLVCSPGPTKPEAAQLATQVENWIELRYGSKVPKDPRELDQPSLFLALTKFDMSLGTLRSGNARERWESRVGEACIDFWAKGPTSWVHAWGGKDRPFTNLYWIRNPYADQMMTLKPGQADYAVVKTGYEESAVVRRHIGAAAEKWAAVEGEDPETQLPRSGIPLLARALRQKLAEDVKGRELAEEARALHREFSLVLQGLAPTNDEAELRARKVAQAQGLADALQGAMTKQMSGAPFGAFVAGISIPYQELWLACDRLWVETSRLAIKDSDKVKKLLVGVLKWWRTRAAQRLREAAVVPQAAVETFLKELLTAKRLVAKLGPAVFPQFKKTQVDVALVARILHVKTVDAALSLFQDDPRRTPPAPFRLSYAESVQDAASGGIDWNDVDFGDDDADAPALPTVTLVFAGKGRCDQFLERLAPFYLENAELAPAGDVAPERRALGELLNGLGAAQ
jgi:hypothetical protein